MTTDDIGADLHSATGQVAAVVSAVVSAVEQADASSGRTQNVAEQAEAAVAEQADDLLLTTTSRRLAAQVSEEQPYGLPGRRGDQGSPFRWGFAATSGALLALVAGQALATVEHQILLIVVAAFVAIGLDPAVSFLVRRGLRRGLAVAVIAITFLAAVAGFIAAAVPPLVSQAQQLTTNTPGYLTQLDNTHTVLGRLNLKMHLTDLLNSQAAGRGVSAGGLLHAGSIVLNATFETIIVLVLIIYFLADLAKIKKSLYRLAPRHRRPRVGLLGDEILSRVGGYVLGNVLTSVVAIVATFVVLMVLGVPYALVLSIAVGVLDLVPLVGSTLAGVVVVLVTLATVSTTAAVEVTVFFVLYRLFEDYVLNPRVMRRTVDVSPLVTVIAVLIGGSLLGITGALIAVPVAAAVQLILQEVVYPVLDTERAPSP